MELIDWKSVILSFLSTSGVWTFIAFAMKEKIKQYFSKNMAKDIEKFKQELDSLREIHKFELQKEMIAIQAEYKNKQKIYPEIYKKFIVAEGKFHSLQGLFLRTSEAYFDLKDFEKIMVERKVIRGTINDILSKISSNKEQGIKEFKKLMDHLNYNDARNAFQDAKNYLLINEFYLSIPIAKDFFKGHDYRCIR